MEKNSEQKRCKYDNKHLQTIKQYIKCLYNIEGCTAGGSLHILLDDDNYDDDSILLCLKDCLIHPEREESKIGRLICEEYLRLSMPERRLLTYPYLSNYQCLCREDSCEGCFIEDEMDK